MWAMRNPPCRFNCVLKHRPVSRALVMMSVSIPLLCLRRLNSRYSPSSHLEKATYRCWCPLRLLVSKTELAIPAQRQRRGRSLRTDWPLLKMATEGKIIVRMKFWKMMGIAQKLRLRFPLTYCHPMPTHSPASSRLVTIGTRRRLQQASRSQRDPDGLAVESRTGTHRLGINLLQK